MPYRTSQKPMDITVTLTNEELKEAVRKYVDELHGSIPTDFTSGKFNTITEFGNHNKIVGMNFTFNGSKTK